MKTSRDANFVGTGVSSQGRNVTNPVLGGALRRYARTATRKQQNAHESAQKQTIEHELDFRQPQRKN